MFRIVVALFFLIQVSISLQAQAPETALDYLKYLSSREEELSKRYLSYMSEVAHGNRARKMEKRRSELIAAIRQSLSEANRLRPFKGDATLRDAYKNYWDVLLKVFNEDYAKIVNMEEIAEQSYDNMEAYLLAQEKADEVLDLAARQIGPVFEAFAIKNNIKLIETESKMEKKLHQVSRVNEYYHQLYLIFFKSFKQEVYVMDAFNQKDINSLEQNRTTLVRFADEGLARLDTIKDFDGDGSVKTACRKVLEYHKNEGEKQIPVQNEFLLQYDEFEKIRKAFDAKPAARRTQADIDQYNKSINEFNKVLTESNKSLQVINASREKVMHNWEITVKAFMEHHVPHGK